MAQIQWPSALKASRLHPNAVIGAMSYLSVIEGITVLQVTGSAEQTAFTIKTASRHATAGLGYEINLAGAKPKTPEEMALNLLCALPGVGIARARDLLQAFGSISAVLAAPEATVAGVVGPATAAKIHQLLGWRI